MFEVGKRIKKNHMGGKNFRLLIIYYYNKVENRRKKIKVLKNLKLNVQLGVETKRKVVF